jgi:hypothetical protein
MQIHDARGATSPKESVLDAVSGPTLTDLLAAADAPSSRRKISAGTQINRDVVNIGATDTAATGTRL